MNKYHMSLASFIHDYKTEVKFSGTKRFCDKSGDYYLKNVLVENNKSTASTKMLTKISLDDGPVTTNNNNRYSSIQQFKRKSSEIKTKMPMNTLTPIPMINKQGSRSTIEGRKITKAERTAVHIRRMEYSTLKRQKIKPLSRRVSSIIFIQRWWRTIFLIIKIQKFYRGWIYRKKLIANLNYEESFIEKLLIFEGICNKIIMKYYLRKCIRKEDICILNKKKKSKPITVNVKGNNKEKINNKSKRRLSKGDIALLKKYIHKWKYKEQKNIMSHSTIIALLKLNKRRYIKRIKIDRAISHILKKVLKSAMLRFKTIERLQRKKKVFRTFENTLSKQPQVTITNNQETIQTTIYSTTYNNNKEESNCNKTYPINNSSFVSLDEDEIKQINAIKKQFILQESLNKWREIAMLKNICKKIKKNNRANDKELELKEAYRKWRRYVHYKDEQNEIILLLVHLLRHNIGLKKKDQMVTHNLGPFLLDKPFSRRLKKDFSSISEKEEIESFFDNNAYSNSQFQAKPSSSIIEKESSFELKKNSKQEMYLKRKSQSNNQNEEDEYQNDSVFSFNDNGQLDKNANLIQYDEVLASKNQKSKVNLSFLGITNESFEIQSASSIGGAYFNCSRIKQSVSLCHQDTQTVQFETREIGIGTEKEERAKLIEYLFNNSIKKDYMIKWKSNIKTGNRGRSQKNIMTLNKKSIQEKKRPANIALASLRRNKQQLIQNGLDYEISNSINTFNNTITKAEDKEDFNSENDTKDQRRISPTRTSNKEEEDNVYLNTPCPNQTVKKILFDQWREKATKDYIIRLFTKTKKINKTIVSPLVIYSKSAKKKNQHQNNHKQKQDASVVIINKINYIKLSQCYNLWCQLTTKRIQYQDLTFQLQSILNKYYNKLALSKLKASINNPLVIYFKKWKTKTILPRLTLFMKRRVFLIQFNKTKQFDILNKCFIRYYTQAKTITSKKVTTFIYKCTSCLVKNNFSVLLKGLCLIRLLKKIIFREKILAPKNDCKGKKCNLYESFKQWKITKDLINTEYIMRDNRNCDENTNDVFKISRQNRTNSLINNSMKQFTFGSKSLIQSQNETFKGHNEKNIHPKRNILNRNKNQYSYTLHDSRRFNLHYSFNHFSPKSKDFSKEDLSNTINRHRSFDLISTKRETLKPIIYSSQSFYLAESTNIQESKVNLQSNFYSIFNIPTTSSLGDSIKNSRIQVTKATIPIDSPSKEDNDELDEFSEKAMKNNLMASCRNDLNALNKNEDNINGDIDFAFPIREKSLLQFKTLEAKEEIKKITLINLKKTHAITQKSHHRRYNTFTQDEANAIRSKLNDNDNNNNIIKHSFTKEMKPNGTFQLKEINSTQFYHSPIKHSNTIENNSAGIYTNITKSSKRGKMPVFHSKKNSMNNTTTSISLLSLNQQNELNQANEKYDDIKKSFCKSNLYDCIDNPQQQPQSSSRSHWDISVNVCDNKSLTNRIFSNDYYSYDNNPFVNCLTQGNIFDTHNTNANIKVYDTISPTKTNVFNGEYTTRDNKSKTIPYNNSMPKLIKTKTIQFKHKEKQRENKDNDNNGKNNYIINLKITYGHNNLLLLKDYYFKGQKILLFHNLKNVAKSISNHASLFYLMKITLMHRGTKQLSILKKIINKWKLQLKGYKRHRYSFKAFNSINSLLLIQGNKNDNHIIEDIDEDSEVNVSNYLS